MEKTEIKETPNDTHIHIQLHQSSSDTVLKRLFSASWRRISFYPDPAYGSGKDAGHGGQQGTHGHISSQSGNTLGFDRAADGAGILNGAGDRLVSLCTASLFPGVIHAQRRDVLRPGKAAAGTGIDD